MISIAPLGDSFDPSPALLVNTDNKPEYHPTVHDIAPDDRPRERLQKFGADTLSTSDLLAIILRTGTQRDNVMEMATKILIKYGGLAGLMSADFHELSGEYGLGLAKTAQLKAALELGKQLSTFDCYALRENRDRFERENVNRKLPKNAILGRCGQIMPLVTYPVTGQKDLPYRQTCSFTNEQLMR